MKQIIILFCFFAFLSCKSKYFYQPYGLKKLGNNEIIDRTKSNSLSIEDAVIKDIYGNIISKKEISNFKSKDYYCDRYKNIENKIVELVIRKKTRQDIKLIEKLNFINLYGTYADSIENKIKIHCNDTRELLKNVLDADVKNRADENIYNPIVDIKNQIVVLNIVKQCSASNLRQKSNDELKTIFLIILHSQVKTQRKYRFIVKKLVEDRKLEKSSLAFLDDKISISNSGFQIYGTQYYFDEKLQKNIIYPIKDSSNVNTLRSKKGLSLIEEYEIKINSN